MLDDKQGAATLAHHTFVNGVVEEVEHCLVQLGEALVRDLDVEQPRGAP